MSYLEVLSEQHRACDQLFAGIEQHAYKGDWTAAASAAQAFVNDTEVHFAYEEGVLFPALEAASPNATGPTSVMRSEHAQMRELFAALLAATAEHDTEALADAVETLLFVMQQHNAKEENVLYPIADRLLPADGAKELGSTRKVG